MELDGTRFRPARRLLACIEWGKCSARELHARFRSASETLGLRETEVQTGIHLGEVVWSRDHDLFGDAVNVAARLSREPVPDTVSLARQWPHCFRKPRLRPR